MLFSRLVGDSERSCRIVVAFSDPRFLPVSLLVAPDDCSGYQTASLRLPESLADSYASIQWYVLKVPAEVFYGLTYFQAMRRRVHDILQCSQHCW